MGEFLMSTNCFKLLIVEDEVSISEIIKKAFQNKFTTIEITVVSNRDDAFILLENEDIFYDLVTLDLRIPSSLNSLDHNTLHGQAVLGECRNRIRGTPILLITGTSTVHMISDFLQSSEHIDIWGNGNIEPTIGHIRKEDLDLIFSEVDKIYNNFSALNDIELLFLNESNILIEYERLIKIFAKKHSGRKVIINILTGFSKAKVYSLEIKDVNENTILKAVAKCGPHYKIHEDSKNYDNAVIRLPPEATPRKIDIIKFGGGTCSAVFYGLAEGYNHSFFRASENNLLTLNINKTLSSLMFNWHNVCHQKELMIGDIRRVLLSDVDAKTLISQHDLFFASAFEDNIVKCNVSFQHCDLHGENILVNLQNNTTLLIDYGDIQETVRILDPLTLECSYLFHPNSQKYNWPTESNINNWDDIEKYTENCPVRSEILFCRSWIEDLKNNNQELSACLYAYALRQLKFEGTNKDRAISLIHKAVEIYNKPSIS
ncbi:response regulator [Acinetobacter proteolyticus]|uniref:response regulator n=1 Tax=Acinetobacter proteolyticus TaxID=1776741 RepID=UPI0031D08932